MASYSNSSTYIDLPSSDHSSHFSYPPSHYLAPDCSSNSLTRLLNPQINLPIRLSPYPPQLSALDARDNNILREHRHHLLPQSLVYEQAEVEEMSNAGGGREREREMLDQHVTDRIPYVQLASQRLQAVMGTRNDRVFDLPSLSLGCHASNLSLESLYDIPNGSIWGTESGVGGIAKLKLGSKSLASDVDLGADFETKKGKRHEKRAGAHLEIQDSVMPCVDKVTGAGLREFLMSKLRGGSSRQRRCGSITICDFTSDMRIHGYSKQLLGHWEGADEKGQRVEVHEVDLPSTSVNISTGNETKDTETWIWFLISRPVLNLLAPSSSDQLDCASPSISDMSSCRYKSSTRRESPSSVNQPNESLRVPPNFPYPIPSSWIVFACPKTHITCYPETTEKIEDDKNSRSQSAYPKSTNALHTQEQTQGIYHRADYDISHFGIPIFEFSSHRLFDGQNVEFSSVSDMEGWDENDSYLPYTTDEYEVERENAAKFAKQEKNEYGEEQGIDPPCPNHGNWWHKFCEDMYKDARRWKKIKHAMGRGKCRVVVRWGEPESEATSATKATKAEDEDIEHADHLLKDIGLGISGVVAHARKKSRSSLCKEKTTVGKHRATRSETRRRSGLASEILLASSCDGPFDGFEHAAAKGQKREKLRGNRKSAPVVKSGFL